MRPAKALEQLKPLLKEASFTSQEARVYGVSAATLAHYVKKGELTRIGHGVYRGVHAPTTEDFRWEDLVEAVQKIKGGVICLISALALYDMTEEIPRAHWIAIHNDTSHRASDSERIVRMRNLELGKTKINVGGVRLPIFDKERTIVDAFRFLSIEVAIKALRAGLQKKGADKIDIKKLSQYARALRVKIDPYVLAATT